MTLALERDVKQEINLNPIDSKYTPFGTCMEIPSPPNGLHSMSSSITAVLPQPMAPIRITP